MDIPKTKNMKNVPRDDMMLRDASYFQSPRRLWIFLILGVVIIVAGIVISGLYFNIQAITTSVNHTEILPTYIVSLVVVVCGAFVILLFWRRPIVLVFFSVICCIGCGGLCAVIAILTGTHVLQPIISLDTCDYITHTSQCVCFSPYKKTLLQLEYSDSIQTRYIFERTKSCTALETELPTLLYSLCGLYVVVFLLCVITTVFAFLVLRVERSRLHGCQEEPYEEIFTISGSSSSLTDSENDVNVMEKDTASIIAPSQIGSCRGTGSVRGISGSCRGGDSENQKQGILKPFNKQENQSLINSSRLSRSCDSIDVIYAHTKGNCVEEANNGWGIPQKGTGKLKEHRRKDRRAVTLHNLDTKQLMLILSLQMRYLEETKKLQSQGNLNEAGKQDDIPMARRAMTPQPYHQKNFQSHTLQRNKKASTPQPSDNFTNSDKVKDSDIEPVYGVPLASSKVRQREARDIEAFQNLVQASKNNTGLASSGVSQNMHCFDKQLNQKPKKKKKKDIVSSNSMPNKKLNDVGKINEFDLNHPLEFASRSKSRTSVQHFFLPPEPVHRSKSTLPSQPLHREVTSPPVPQHRETAEKTKLPPQPIRRTAETKANLPQEPVHRTGSAFQMVGKSNRRIDTRGDNDKFGPMYGRSVMSHDSILANPGEFYYQQAIRDNFRLCANPFMLQTNSPAHSVNTSELTFQSEPPPPYAPPPTYRDFLSISQDGSVLSDSQDENTDRESISYMNPHNEIHNGNWNVTSEKHLQESDMNYQGQQNVYSNEQPMFSASDDDVFISGNLSQGQSSQQAIPVYSQVIKRNQIQSPSHVPNGIVGSHQPNQVMYSNQNSYQKQIRPINNYEEIDDIDMNYAYNDDSSFGISSQTSLIPGQFMPSNQRKHLHHLDESITDDSEVLETMI